jgi:hypothetical protein
LGAWLSLLRKRSKRHEGSPKEAPARAVSRIGIGRHNPKQSRRFRQRQRRTYRIHSQRKKNPRRRSRKPLLVRTQVKFIYALGNVVIGAAILWLWSRSVAHTRGFEGALKVASVTIVPLIAFTYVIEMTRRGFTRANALGKTVRTKVISFSFAFLIFLPVLWRKIGYQEICWHVFIGGAIGLAVAFLSWLYLVAKRHPWLMQQQDGQWVWVYRFSAAVPIFAGGWIGVTVS